MALEFNDNRFKVDEEDSLIEFNPYLGEHFNVKDIIVPEGIKVIKQDAFKFCKGFETIVLPSTLIKIEDAAFYGCDKLNKIEFPENLTEIGNYAFGANYSLKEVIFNNNLQKIGKGAFKEDLQIKSLNFPKGLKYIGQEAFRGCERVEEVLVPDSVDYIGEYAFSYMYANKKVTIGPLQELPAHCFEANLHLREIDFGRAIRKIGQYAFCNCNDLIEVELNFSIKEVNEKAFYSCNKLAVFSYPDDCNFYKDENSYVKDIYESNIFGDNINKIYFKVFDHGEMMGICIERDFKAFEEEQKQIEEERKELERKTKQFDELNEKFPKMFTNHLSN